MKTSRFSPRDFLQLVPGFSGLDVSFGTLCVRPRVLEICNDLEFATVLRVDVATTGSALAVRVLTVRHGLSYHRLVALSVPFQ